MALSVGRETGGLHGDGPLGPYAASDEPGREHRGVGRAGSAL